MSQSGQRTGQRTDDVGQTTGLGKRDAFGSSKCNIHDYANLLTAARDLGAI
jgi:hypothetical protein